MMTNMRLGIICLAIGAIVSFSLISTQSSYAVLLVRKRKVNYKAVLHLDYVTVQSFEPLYFNTFQCENDAGPECYNSLALAKSLLLNRENSFILIGFSLFSILLPIYLKINSSKIIVLGSNFHRFIYFSFYIYALAYNVFLVIHSYAISVSIFHSAGEKKSYYSEWETISFEFQVGFVLDLICYYICVPFTIVLFLLTGYRYNTSSNNTEQKLNDSIASDKQNILFEVQLSKICETPQQSV